MKCKQHPSYKGRNEPLARCARCREIYEHANALAIARKERERHIANLRLERALRDAIGQIHDFEKHVAAIKALRESKRTQPIRPQQGRNTSEATAVVLATDWHFGSRIKPEQVNGLNRFDVATCKKRVETFFERVARMIRKEQQDVKITNLVLFLGGDLINGSLHRDTEMSDEIAQPIEQAIQCQALVESGINYLLNHANISNITIPCCDGNHGRVTPKQHWSSRQGNALEYYMYANLASRFPQLNWVFAPGLLIYQQIYGWNVRFNHGDTIHFGGIKGPHEYLTRAIYFWDTAICADYTVLGHLHCWNIGTRRWQINGSLVGYSPFAVAMRGEYQPPIQSFFLIDRDRGPTVQIPILL